MCYTLENILIVFLYIVKLKIYNNIKKNIINRMSIITQFSLHYTTQDVQF